MEAAPPHWDGAMPWRAGRQVSGTVPGVLLAGVPPPEGGRKGGGGKGDGMGFPSYQKSNISDNYVIIFAPIGQLSYYS